MSYIFFAGISYTNNYTFAFPTKKSGIFWVLGISYTNSIIIQIIIQKYYICGSVYTF